MAKCKLLIWYTIILKKKKKKKGKEKEKGKNTQNLNLKAFVSVCSWKSRNREEMGGSAQALKRIPRIKFPQRHPKLSGSESMLIPFLAWFFFFSVSFKFILIYWLDWEFVSWAFVITEKFCSYGEMIDLFWIF